MDILFASDLDNTLLFSYRYREETDLCVEHLDGREQGFFTKRSIELLAEVNRRTRFVPVTSRSVEQYLRIRFPDGCVPRYAVTTNGAILLEDGRVDPAWYEASAGAVEPWRAELRRVYDMLPASTAIRRYRMVDDMYLFAACDDPADAEAGGAYFRDRTELDVAVSGRKVYFFPPPINKGAAVERLRARFEPEETVSAGDSRIDLPMLLKSDLALVPESGLLHGKGDVPCGVKPEGTRFPDFVLEQVLERADRR